MRNNYQLPNMGGTTISKRLTVQLIAELKNGMFADASRLPSEVELAELFNVSRSVIRDTMADLEREGYVERMRGLGTEINRHVVELDNRLDLKLEYNDLVKSAGAYPGTDSVLLYPKTADKHLAAKLEIDEGEALVVCEKRVLANSQPVIYSIDYLAVNLFKGKNWNAFDWSAPIFQILWAECGIAIDASITRLSAQMGPEKVREKLRVAAGEPLILLDEVGTYKLSKPIFYSNGYYTNFFDFTLLRKKF